jgi:prophage regulatory protein
MSTNTNAHFDLPTTGFVRVQQLIGRPAKEATKKSPAKDAIPGIIPISPATLWRKVKVGEFPKPVKLSAGVTAWRVEDVRAWMQSRVAS